MARLTNQGVGQPLGTLILRQLSGGGLELVPNLRQLPPGADGFHLHTVPDCRPGLVDGRIVPGGAAGGHWDPTGVLNGHSHGHGHDHGVLPLGDLPPLQVGADGRATTPLKLLQFSDLASVRGRAVMIHEGLNGPRYACGIIP